MNYDTIYEFVEPHPSGGICTVRMTARQAIEWSRKVHRQYSDLPDPCDEDLLTDFICVHWASPVKEPEGLLACRRGGEKGVRAMNKCLKCGGALLRGAILSCTNRMCADYVHPPEAQLVIDHLRRQLTEVQAQRDDLMYRHDTLACDIASALGWEVGGKPWTDCIRELRAENERLRKAVEDAYREGWNDRESQRSEFYLGEAVEDAAWHDSEAAEAKDEISNLRHQAENYHELLVMTLDEREAAKEDALRWLSKEEP